MCALCGGTEVSRHLVHNGFHIVECKVDGLMFVSPRPADVSPFYDERYYTGGFPGLYTDYTTHAVSMQREWESRLSAMQAQVGSTGRLLDVGAATGDFLVLARQRGWTTAGVEMSEFAAAKARDEKHLDVTTGDLHGAALATGSVDAITLWDCIEHLSAPADTLREAARILVPGGLIAISTGAVPHRDPGLLSGWYYPPWHLYYFSVETLSDMCVAAGFDVIDSTITDADTPYALMTVFAKTRQGVAD